jgi:MoaA/NifB/PqqE/SkfB family radical SAM enzyme
MLALENIKNLHLEITSLCNARCPLCVRNANGFPHNFGYPETSLSLAQIKSLFSVDFVKQLTSIDYCGNFGDFVMNPDALEIAEYFQLNNPSMITRISTNGSARNKQFWQALGRLGHNVHITFCIDGLEDTHLLYRVDTNWKNIIRNAQDFIEGGGTAVWKMIKFDHNAHQVEQCRALATELGFHRFDFTDHGRNTGPVFDRAGEFQYYLGAGAPELAPTVSSVIEWHTHAPFHMPEEKNTIKCYSKTEKSIYIAADGSVYPCCYLGAYPTTFSNGSWYKQTHQQIQDLMPLNNNALEVGLESALAWFNSVEESWNKTKYTDGRLILCDAHCGTKYQKWDRKTLE